MDTTRIDTHADGTCEECGDDYGFNEDKGGGPCKK